MDVAIEAVAAGDVAPLVPALAALLQDAVEGGASVGFLPPLGIEEAAGYWRSLAAAISEGRCVLLVARAGDGSVVGTVQLVLETRPNGRHRAEIAKLIVLRVWRGRGIGGALMRAVEGHARRLGRTTLFLDTRLGDPAEHVYRSAGWTFAGSIPRYARSATDALDANAIYWKLLDPS